MIISNRLMSAALHALASQLTADASLAAKSGISVSAHGEYIHQIHGIRAQLACYGEDLSVNSAKVLLPGEKA